MNETISSLMKCAISESQKRPDWVVTSLQMHHLLQSTQLNEFYASILDKADTLPEKNDEVIASLEKLSETNKTLDDLLASHKKTSHPNSSGNKSVCKLLILSDMYDICAILNFNAGTLKQDHLTIRHLLGVELLEGPWHEQHLEIVDSTINNKTTCPAGILSQLQYPKSYCEISRSIHNAISLFLNLGENFTGSNADKPTTFLIVQNLLQNLTSIRGSIKCEQAALLHTLGRHAISNHTFMRAAEAASSEDICQLFKYSQLTSFLESSTQEDSNQEACIAKFLEDATQQLRALAEHKPNVSLHP